MSNMKKLILLFVLAVCFACTNEGEIQATSERHIKINDKEYKFIRIVPADNYRAVWILVPLDATIEVPPVISARVSCGKNCTEEQTALLVGH